MVVFRKVVAMMLTIFFAFTSIAVAAPRALDGATVEKNVTGVTSVSQTVEPGSSSASAFALVQDKSSAGLAESKSSSGIMNAIPLSPALMLFAGALGAIFWLGRRRKAENSNWE
jgi:hypothetical protein